MTASDDDLTDVPQLGVLYCVACLGEAHMFDGPDDQVPHVAVALTVVNGMATCAGHVAFQRKPATSGLLLPQGPAPMNAPGGFGR